MEIDNTYWLSAINIDIDINIDIVHHFKSRDKFIIAYTQKFWFHTFKIIIVWGLRLWWAIIK